MAHLQLERQTAFCSIKVATPWKSFDWNAPYRNKQLNVQGSLTLENRRISNRKNCTVYRLLYKFLICRQSSTQKGKKKFKKHSLSLLLTQEKICLRFWREGYTFLALEYLYTTRFAPTGYCTCRLYLVLTRHKQNNTFH